MTVAVVERGILAEHAKTEGIKELRKFWEKDNESTYVEGGIESLSFTLLGVCDKKVYLGEEVSVYFEILDLRDCLKEKYSELSDSEALKHKEDVEVALNEAQEILDSLYIEIIK